VNPLLKADLHIHTVYSSDALTSLQDVVARCLKIGINCIAVTDHNTILGALKVRELAPFPVIVGEEINTRSGEIIGYFLNEEVPPRLPAIETVRRIKEQGGLVCIPHPFDRFRRSKLHQQELVALLPHIDIIEVFNSRVLRTNDNLSARLFALTYGLPGSAGSDAHVAAEIGKAYVQMPEFNDKEGFLQSLSQGVMMVEKSSPLIHLWSIWAKLMHLVKGR
jgi:predicted metal-dependent phosphoesterase TrpH